MGFDFRKHAENLVYPVDMTISGKDVHLDLLPPTVAMVREMSGLTDGKNDMDTVAGVVTEILNNNRNGIKISEEAVSTITIDMLYAFTASYSTWLGGKRKEKN